MLQGEGGAGIGGQWGSAGLLALATVLIALAIVPSMALAASTRAEYVAQVDPICQAGQAQEATASQRLIRTVKRAKKHHALDKTRTQKKLARLFASYFTQYAAIEHQVNNQIAAVPPAPDDVSLVQVWLRARNELVDLESRVFSALRHPKRLKNPLKVFGSFFEISARQFEVFDLVRDFGFQYCTSAPPLLVIAKTARS